MALLSKDNLSSNMHNRIERLLIPFDLICDVDLGCIRYLKSDKFKSDLIDKSKDEALYYSEDHMNPVKFMMPTISDIDADKIYTDLFTNDDDNIQILTYANPMQLSNMLVGYMSLLDEGIIDVFVCNKQQEEYVALNYNSPKINSIYFDKIDIAKYDNIFIKYYEEIENFELDDLKGKSVTFFGIAHNNNISTIIQDIFYNNLISSRLLSYNPLNNNDNLEEEEEVEINE